ncbi:MAG: radical SAM protein [bacterium]|nr:radical SAM protein [bacterium]
MTIVAEKPAPDFMQSYQSITCTDCSICPRRHMCPQGASGHGSLPSHGSNCPSSQTLADDKGGLLVIPRRGKKPIYQLEWNKERVKITRDRLESASFDPAGRLFSFSVRQSIWRRGLDGRILEISHIPADASKMPACFFHVGRVTDKEEAETWEKWVEEFVADAKAAFGPHPALEIPLKTERLQDAENFLKIFNPVGILPPDQYRSLVLQLTEGCSYNKCAFCDFFKRGKFRMKSADEFREHVKQAFAYFGESLIARQGIFIGEANAVSVPDNDLLNALDIIREAVDNWNKTNPMEEQRFAKIFSFLDTFTVKRTASQWRALKDKGLDRLYLGVESGSKNILNLLNKPGSAEHTIELITTLKEAGLRVGPIVMTGVGGKEMAQDHLEATAAMLNKLPLTSDDRIYISEFLVVEGSEYARRAKERNLTELNRMECREQSRALRNMLRFEPPPQGPAVALYDVRQFIY